MFCLVFVFFVCLFVFCCFSLVLFYFYFRLDNYSKYQYRSFRLRSTLHFLKREKWDIEGFLGSWPGYVISLKLFLEVVIKRKSDSSDVSNF